MKIKESEIEDEFYTVKIELNKIYAQCLLTVKDVKCRKDPWKQRWTAYLQNLKKHDFVIPGFMKKEPNGNLEKKEFEKKKKMHFIKALLRYNLMRWVVLDAEIDDNVEAAKIKNIDYEKTSL